MVVFVAVALMLVSGLAGCQSPQESPAPTETVAPTPTPVPVLPLSFGDAFESDGIRIVPLDVRVVAELWPTYPGIASLYLKPNDGEVFLLLDVDIYNDTDQEQDLSDRLKATMYIETDESHRASIAIEQGDMSSLPVSGKLTVAPGQNRAHFVISRDVGVLPIDASTPIDCEITLDEQTARCAVSTRLAGREPLQRDSTAEQFSLAAMIIITLETTNQVMPLNIDQQAVIVDVLNAKDGQTLQHAIVRVQNIGEESFDATRIVRGALIDANGIEHQMQTYGDAGNGRNLKQSDLIVEPGQTADVHFILPIDAAGVANYTNIRIRLGDMAYDVVLPEPTADENAIAESTEQSPDEDPSTDPTESP